MLKTWVNSVRKFFSDPTTKVTHNYFFGENIRRVVNSFKRRNK